MSCGCQEQAINGLSGEITDAQVKQITSDWLKTVPITDFATTDTMVPQVKNLMKQICTQGAIEQMKDYIPHIVVAVILLIGGGYLAGKKL